MKRVSPAGVTFVVVAILVGLGAAYVVRHLSRPAEQQARTAGRKMTKIVVAKYNLGQYTRIIDDYVEEVPVPADKVPEGALTLKSRALYRLAKVTIPAGQPIREQDLYEVGEVPLLSERLPPGYRAVTLAVDAKAAVNGMIQPESLVDITLTVKNDRPEFGGMATLTLLRRVRVLATSRNRFPAAEDRPTDLRNITVAVTPEQANKLILAEKYGTLSVVLCSQQEEAAVPTDNPEVGEVTAIPTGSTSPQPVATDQLEGSNLVNIYTLLGISPLQPQSETPKPETKTAQIWRGSEVQEVTFASWQIREAENATLVAQGEAPRPFTPGALNSNVSSHKDASEEDCPECAAKRAKEAARASAGNASPTPAPHPAVLPGQASVGRGGYGRVVTLPGAHASAGRP
jgi:pilus assembly protein CpaB